MPQNVHKRIGFFVRDVKQNFHRTIFLKILPSLFIILYFLRHRVNKGEGKKRYIGAIAGAVVDDNVVKFAQKHGMLEQFLESEQAEGLMVKDLRALETEIKQARTSGFKKGWDRLRGFLATAADVVTLATPFLRGVIQ